MRNGVVNRDYGGAIAIAAVVHGPYTTPRRSPLGAGQVCAPGLTQIGGFKVRVVGALARAVPVIPCDAKGEL